MTLANVMPESSAGLEWSGWFVGISLDGCRCKHSIDMEALTRHVANLRRVG